MHTRLFLDSGDPADTRILLSKDVLLAGQTTNPSLVAKNPAVVARVEAGDLFTTDEINGMYRGIVEEIAGLVEESVSIEVYADLNTSADEMIAQAKEMNQWIPNAHIKLPTIPEGLHAANALSDMGIKLNMTLCFTQQQAAAVYAATKGAPKGSVFLSPFIGRFDDKGQDGVSGVANIKRMFEVGDGHVEILAASIRSQKHLMACYAMGVDIITAPTKVLEPWADDGHPMPGDEYVYDSGDLTEIQYEEIDLEADWQSFDLSHQLVDEGVEKFVADWQKLLK
ncbi:MAG: transaldolase family protein [Patescibacteria group bacterium]